MADFRILVGGGHKGRHFNLEFAIDKKPKTLVALYIPAGAGPSEELEIKADKGRRFGDNEADGTPVTVSVGKWKAPAVYFDKGTYGQVFIGVKD